MRAKFNTEVHNQFNTTFGYVDQYYFSYKIRRLSLFPHLSHLYYLKTFYSTQLKSCLCRFLVPQRKSIKTLYKPFLDTSVNFGRI